MLFIVALLLFFILAIRLRVPAFETVFGALLLAPVILHLLGNQFILGPWLTIATFIAIFLALTALLRAEALPDANNDAAGWRYGLDRQAPVLLVFLCSFLILYRLCYLWPDFISIGERLRDYALLAATFESPTRPSEPWMSQTVLNYYVYWYRFGYFLGKSLDLQVWETYHLLAAFVSAFYLTSIFRLFTKFLGFSISGALIAAVVIALGSNTDAIGYVFANDSNWWGPSRVIKGSITEFPAWSFVLGDLHPHYLNLTLLPFFSVLLLGMLTCHRKWDYLGIAAALALAVLPLWVFNSNAWEMPAWAFYVFWLSSVSFLVLLRSKENRKRLLRFEYLKFLNSRRGSLVALAIVLIVVSLYLSQEHINSGERALRLVKGEIVRSTISEMLRVWGVPLFFLASSLPLLFPQRGVRIFFAVFLAVALLVAMFSGSAIAFLLPLYCACMLFALFAALGRHRISLHSWPMPAQVFILACPLIALSLVVFPEFLFFDDEYGGEIERMNTIFKFYSAGWYFMHVAAFAFLSLAWQQIPQGFKKSMEAVFPLWLVKLSFTAVMLAFVVHTIPYRKSEALTFMPISQGLTSIDKRFPGAALAIQRFERLPRGVTLEAQGNAYDYTTHVATLSGNTSYLGWSNHIGLLTKLYDEVKRREDMTNSIYNEPECEQKRALLIKEKIRYVVIGPLEKARYPQLNRASFACLKEVVSSGEYSILSSI